MLEIVVETVECQQQHSPQLQRRRTTGAFETANVNGRKLGFPPIVGQKSQACGGLP